MPVINLSANSANPSKFFLICLTVSVGLHVIVFAYLSLQYQNCWVCWLVNSPDTDEQAKPRSPVIKISLKTAIAKPKNESVDAIELQLEARPVSKNNSPQASPIDSKILAQNKPIPIKDNAAPPVTQKVVPDKTPLVFNRQVLTKSIGSFMVQQNNLQQQRWLDQCVLAKRKYGIATCTPKAERLGLASIDDPLNLSVLFTQLNAGALDRAEMLNALAVKQDTLSGLLENKTLDPKTKMFINSAFVQVRKELVYQDCQGNVNKDTGQCAGGVNIIALAKVLNTALKIVLQEQD